MGKYSAKLQAEFQKELDSRLTEEEKVLIKPMKSEYIDLMMYVEWLEKKLAKERINNLKRTK